MADLINALSTAELAEFAKNEFGEDETQMKKDVNSLLQWIDKSPHLQSIRKDDAFLRVFLRGCKYSLERTKEKIDFFFTVRGSCPEFFSDWNPALANVKTVINAGIIIPLRGYDKQGRYVLLLKPGNLNPSTSKLEDLLKCNMMLTELAMRDNTQAVLKGVSIIQEMSGMTAGHASLMSASLAKKITTIFQDAYPNKPKAIHVLNVPGIMESLLTLMQSLQKQKMRERQHVHPKGDYSKLVEELGTDILPKEYGGTNGTLDEHREFWKTEVVKNADWLLQQTKYKTDESKRPGKPRSHADLFGIEGSFRKLEID